MKIEELMIGDLVKYNNEIYKVVGIYGSSQMVDLYPYHIKSKENKYLLPIFKHISDISPIPLTNDILKANAWHERQYSCVYDRDGVPFGLDIGKIELYLGECSDDDTIIFSLLYVHELQNVFRICSLNELADNLKLN